MTGTEDTRIVAQRWLRDEHQPLGIFTGLDEAMRAFEDAEQAERESLTADGLLGKGEVALFDDPDEPWELEGDGVAHASLTDGSEIVLLPWHLANEEF